MRLFILLSAFFISTAAIAQGDAAAGKTKAAVCMACHGADGVGIAPIFPNLAGQKAAYLVAQLNAFKNGDRTGGNTVQMAPMVATLSDQDMLDLAAFYEGLTPAK